MVKKRYLLSIFALAVAILGHATDKPNVLFIAIDDLRPNLGCYGDTQALTPNIDRLAKQGTLFERAYCQVPICMASRVALLTGIRVPDRNDGTTSRLKTPFVTMPKWFGENGYQTLSNGKIFHVVKDRAEDWSRAPWQAMRHGRELSEEQYEHFWLSPDSRNFNHPDLLNRGPYCEAADVPDNAYQDGQLAGKTIADLKQLAETGEPFFVGCGFWKPHLPFNAPKKYWDLYDPETLELAQNSFLPENGAGATGFSPEFCLYGWTGEPNTAITRELVQTDEGFWREATHGYYACASYVDAQVGKL
ncbi:MAG: sulfatase-like hydrolase/transferase, partial [Coraliomargarita sp.]